MQAQKLSLRELFSEAAEIADPAARAAFLNSACADDATLRTRVERLLAASLDAGNFLRDRSDTTKIELLLEKPGERIGRYRLIERIGRGGGGVVYLAEQEEPVRRRVALKIIKVGMDTESVVARFEAERQALAMMDHPNIAKVLDAGATETGRPFFVMELVSGMKLNEYCERHQLSVGQRLELFIPVCHAVQHAHQKGIVHRDLKPSNILVTEHEGAAVPKVIDFGIAKATNPEAPEDDRTGLTSVNQFIGTPAYMSPEQMEYGGRDIDTRSDIYSLGVILYELLAGQPPFDPKHLAGASVEEMRRIIREVDPPRPSTTIMRARNPARLPYPRRLSRERVAAVRGDLDWIVMKCLEKDRARRYDTANGLAMDIRLHLDNEPVMARPPTPLYRLQKIVRRHRLGFAAAGTIILVLLAAVIVSAQLALRARRAEREQSRLRELAESNATESRQRLIRRYVAEGNRLLEEGRPVAALPWMVQALELETGNPQREADERLRIAQTLVGAPELRLQLTQGKSVNCVALSPDGSRVASGSDDGIVRIADVASGGDTSRSVAMAGNVGRVNFSPDAARVVAMTMGGEARVWDATTGDALTPLLRANDFSAGSIADVARTLNPAASFSPDGKLLLLAWGSKSAQLRDAATGGLVREFAHDQVVYHAAFSPDGRLVVTSSKDGSTRVWDAATGEPAGPTLRHGGYVAWSQFSSEGSKLLTVRERHMVQLWDWREGRRLAPEIPRRSDLFHASLSPNGSNILTTAWSGYAHMYDAGTSRLMYEFQQQGGLIDAAFSPDGNHVATACEDGNAWVWNLGEVNGHPVLLPQGNHIEQIAYSRDGRLLAVGGRAGRLRVWELNPPERGVRRLPGSNVQWVEFDSRGRRVLLLSSGAQSGLSVYDVQTAKLISSAKLTGNEVTRARFSPDGRELLAFGNTPRVFVLDADSGRLIRHLTHRRNVNDAVWSPDGKVILTAAGPAGVHAWESRTGKVALTFAHSNSARALALSADGARLAAAYDDNSVQIWEAATGRPLGESITTRARIRHIQFSPDGKSLAISCDGPGSEGVVELRSVTSGEVIGRPLVHRDRVYSFEFSRDGQLLATACEDHTARVWDSASGEPISPRLWHDYEARQAIFSPDGDRLVTLARRGAARLWNARTGEPLTAPMLYNRNVGNGYVSYSPDGHRLLLCRGGDEAWLRELEPQKASIDELKVLAQVLSCTRFDPAAGMVPIEDAALDEAWKKLRTLRGGPLYTKSRR